LELERKKLMHIKARHGWLYHFHSFGVVVSLSKLLKVDTEGLWGNATTSHGYSKGVVGHVGGANTTNIHEKNDILEK